jgi:hypothetical protein
MSGSDGNHFHSPRFAMRRNDDGTIDAICLACYLTAATAHSEAKLRELEAAHRCPTRDSEAVIPTGSPALSRNRKDAQQ